MGRRGRGCCTAISNRTMVSPPHPPPSSVQQKALIDATRGCLLPALSTVFLDEARENIKLGDFGLSKALGAATFANTYVGTPYYMSPELFSESSYDSKSDIWALGCVIYEMVALQCVFLPPLFPPSSACPFERTKAEPSRVLSPPVLHFIWPRRTTTWPTS